MRRAARLQAAPSWLSRYGGNHLVRSYARWFGVDARCALMELRRLGVDFDPAYLSALEETLRSSPARKRSRQADERSTDMEGLFEGNWL